METNKLIAGIVAAAIAVIVLAGVLMPALANATDTEDTFTNEGLWRMKEIETGDVWARVSDGGTGYKWTLNSEDQITVSSVSNAILGDDWCVRSNGQFRGHSGAGNINLVTATAGNDNVVITGAGLNGSGTQSKTGYGVDNDGDYMMIDYDSSAYLLKDSIIYATGFTGVSEQALIIHIEGTIEDGVTITADSSYNNSGIPTLSNFVASNVQVNYTAVDGYKDLYKFTSITADVAFDITPYGGDTPTSYTGSITYSSVVVPYEVTAEKAVHLSDAMNVILNVIPLLIIVAVLLGVVAVFILRRE